MKKLNDFLFIYFLVFFSKRCYAVVSNFKTMSCHLNESLNIPWYPSFNFMICQVIKALISLIDQLQYHSSCREEDYMHFNVKFTDWFFTPNCILIIHPRNLNPVWLYNIWWLTINVFEATDDKTQFVKANMFSNQWF